MGSRKIFKIMAIQILLLIGVSSCILLEGKSRLTLMDESRGANLLDLTLKDGEEIFLYWRNSLFNLDVIEKFTIDRGTLVLTEVHFFNPSESPPPLIPLKEVEDLYQTGDSFSVQGLKKKWTQIDFRIGEIGHPKLKVKGQVLDLKELVGFGGKVRLTIQKDF